VSPRESRTIGARVAIEPIRLPLSHPAAIAAAVIAAACIVVSVTFRLGDTDFWQHLLVGKAIWQFRSVPTRELWTWPTYGAPDVNASWGFRVLIWPLWSVFGVTGLFAWRWITTLAAFGLLWAAARRLGARGLSTLVVLALAALAYRTRSQIRPETLVSVQLALELWILEDRRQTLIRGESGPDRTAWIALVAWIWANTHISYFLCFIVLGMHIVDAMLASGAAGRKTAWSAHARRLALIGLAGAALSLINPFGWRALAQPFEYMLVWRHELIYRIIEELGPLDWSLNLRNLLPLLVAGWPLLIAWRLAQRRFDRVEILMCALFTTLALTRMRFEGFYALVAAPYVARDLDEWLTSRRWPAWTGRPWARAALTGGACVAIGIPDWTRPDLELGVGIDMSRYPVAACDFIEKYGVRGRGFNKFEFGGYMLYRFWPDRSRLPFMDIHQAGTPADRDLYAAALGSEDAWRALDRKYHFDYAMIYQSHATKGRDFEVDQVADALDADSTWALVQCDDTARLYARREGPMREIAVRHGCEVLPGGTVKMAEIYRQAMRDTVVRARLTRDLERQTALSAYDASIQNLLADVDMMNGRRDRARRDLLAALAVNPRVPRAHERIARLDLLEDKPREALEEIALERKQRTPGVPVDYLTAEAYRKLGDVARARDYYQREVRRNPDAGYALDSLAALDRRADR
jgi:tetratricopeptide (TPR) repeat protein